MSLKSRKAVASALSALQQDVEKLQSNDERQEKVLQSHAEEIAVLQSQVKEMRNLAIASEAKQRVPYKDISARYGVSESRVSQIKKQYSDTKDNH